MAPFRIELALNGKLNNAYFIPRAAQMWNMVQMIRDQRWYDFAITFGTVQGPFTPAPAMPRLGSMQASWYRAQIILTDGNANLADSYDVPIVPTMHRTVLFGIEQWAALNTATPTGSAR